MGHIIVPRISIRHLLPPEPEIAVRLQPQYLHWQVGRYKERLVSGPGGLGRGRIWVPEKEGEQHNLILTQTYDTLIAQYGFVALGNYAVVGTGSAAPNPAQTGLVNEVARTNADTSPAQSNDAEATPGQAVFTRVREFTEAQVGGRNLTEWGFSPAGAAGNNLMCRELFRDGLGNPVVITLDTDQRLRLIYKYTVSYSPAIGTSQDVSVDINGLGTKTGKFFVSRYDGSYSGGLGHIYLLSEWAGNILSAGGGVWGLFHSVVDVPTTPGPNAPGGNNATNYRGNSFTNLSLVGTTPITRGRKINARTFAANQANITWYGVKIYRYYDPGGGSRVMGNVILAFDSGQEFAKSSLYKMIVGEWVLTWGP